MRQSFFRKSIIYFFTFCLLAGGLVFFSTAAGAQQEPLDLGIKQVSSTLGLPTTDIRIVIAKIIKVALGLLGIVALVIMIYGGVVWMTAGGNEDKITTAKKVLINGVIGIAIILSSYAIVSFVMNKLVEATTGNTGQTTTAGGGGGGIPPWVDNSCFGRVYTS